MSHKKFFIAYVSNGTTYVDTGTEQEMRQRGAGATWGPFPSRKCAQWVRERMVGNPHFTSAAAATRIYYKEHNHE